MDITRRQANLVGFLGCAGMMGFALYAQYGLHLQPCNMCVLQRIAVIALGLAFLAATLHDPASLAARLYAVLIASAMLAGIAVSARHIWVQMQPPGSLPSCGADFYTMIQMLPVTDVIMKIWNGGGDCQTILWSLLGLSMPTWVLICVTALGLTGIVANFRLARTGAARV